VLYSLELLAVLLPLLYVLLTAAYAIVFFRDEPGIARLLTPSLSAVLLLHFTYVALRTVLYEHIPLANVYETLTVIGFALALVYWIIERIVKTPNTGMFVLGVVFLFQTISSAFIGHDVDVNPVLRSPLFGAHTTTAVLGYTGFALSAVYGVLYLMLYHELKVNRFGIIYGRLPSLGTLGAMHERAAFVGLIAMTIAIAIGMAWLPTTEFGWALTDPKVAMTLLIWVLYVFVLLGYRYSWTSRVRLIYVSIVGFLLLVLSTIAVNLWLQSFHAFI
jgi:ABC-type uncharacterized transport system permease subunit